jgi:hypothetical protein
LMNYSSVISELQRNRQVFFDLLSGQTKEEYLWKPQPEKWCTLEIVCHLYDEEREDFRARLKQVLETPELPFPSIDPQGWVQSRKYLEQDFETMLKKFCEERNESVAWLKSLASPAWKNAYHHPKFGPLSGNLFLSNWLEHDYLHLRQILTVKHLYLQNHSGETLTYAGNW